MFHSAALRLTLWYLGIIMLISISFSSAIYHLSYGEVRGEAARQSNFLRAQLTPYDFRDFNASRQSQLNTEKQRLINRLVFFNLLVLLLGGAASYQLARRTLRPIEDSLEAQKRFTADASHELRTPLAAMQSEIEVALRGAGLTKKEATDILRSNLEEVAKLKALSEGLLRLASTGNKLSLEQAVDLKPIVEQAISRWQKIADAKKIELNSSITNVSIHGDHQSLVDVVSILIDNAIKYSPPGSQVRVRLLRRDKSAVIEIADKGQGINAKDLPKIFDRFFRADNSRTKNDQGGYGLGLAIAKKIVDLHLGIIEVKSAPGKGSTFTVIFPTA
jgi:two-component system sensor histidine kinase CiaH